MTEAATARTYHVLIVHPGGVDDSQALYKDLGTVHAASPSSAAKKAAKQHGIHKPSTFIVVADGSWHELTGAVKTVEHFVVG